MWRERINKLGYIALTSAICGFFIYCGNQIRTGHSLDGPSNWVGLAARLANAMAETMGDAQAGMGIMLFFAALGIAIAVQIWTSDWFF